MVLTECVKNELLHPYPVLTEKKGEIVAQFKYTIAVRKEGPYVISGLPLDTSRFQSEHTIKDEEILKKLTVNLFFILLIYF